MTESVLVVDDFEHVRRSVKSMLTALGVRNVTEARDAKDALKALNEQHFGYVLCDFNLGKGMDGQQLLEEARNQELLSCQTHFVMITAETTRDMVMGAIEHRPDDYLAKPFTFDTFKVRWKRWQEAVEHLRVINKAQDQRDWKTIVKACEKLIEKSVRYRSWAQRKLIETLIEQGEYKKAKKYLDQFSEMRELPWMLVDYARIHMANDELNWAIPLLKEVVENQPNYVAAFDLLAECYHRLQHVQQETDTLERALQVSPRNYKRQKWLAEITEESERFERSSKAFRQVIALTRGSAQESHVDYMRLLNVMSMDADQAESNQKTVITKEISSLITKMGKKFQDNLEIKLSARVFRLMNYLRDKELTEEQIGEMSDGLGEILANVDQYSRELGFYMAKLLYRSNRYGDGDKVIEALRNHPEADQQFIVKLDALQSEPVTVEARAAATELNKTAREHYEKGDYASALREFHDALTYSPRNPALILNYIQCAFIGGTLHGEMKDRVFELLDRLSYLQPNHKQYNRYLKIKSRLGT